MATIRAKAANLDIEVEAGATFDSTLTWKDSAGIPVDLTNYTAEMQIRDSVDSETVLGTLNTTNLPTDSHIVLGGALGTIQIVIPHAISTAYTFSSAVYDLELQDSTGIKRRLIEGSITILPEVTRA